MKTNGHYAASFIDRLVLIDRDIESLRADKKEVFSELREQMRHEFGDDLDTIRREMAAVRLIIKRRLEDDAKKAKREAVEETAEQIMAALGVLADTPLGQAAVK